MEPAAYRSGGRTVYLMRLAVATAIWLGLALALGPVGPSVQDDMAAAARARASYRYDRALAWYASASATAPDDPDPICQSGDVRTAQGEWALAEAAYLRCLSLHPANVASVWLALGDARAALGDEQDAEEAWQRSAGAGGTDALGRLGDAYESAGNVDAAAAAWKRLPTDDAVRWTQGGILALWHGDVATARSDFSAAHRQPNWATQAALTTSFVDLASGPALNSLGWGKLGYAFLVANHPALALAPLRMATQLDSNNQSAHAYLGWTLLLLAQQGQTPNGTPASFRAAAANELRTALNLNTDDSFAWFAAGSLSEANGDQASALRDYSTAVRLDGRNPAIWSAAGQLELARADYVAADLDLSTAAQLSTRADETVSLLHLYADRGYGMDNRRALAAAATAVQRWSRSEPVRFLQAEIADEAGVPDEALYAAEAAVGLDPTDPGPYVLLGRYAVAAGSYIAAAGYLRVALALAPNGPWAAQAAALLVPLHSLDV